MPKTSPSTTPDPDWEKIRRLYNKGETDRKISRNCKTTIKRIANWRHNNGLPANHIGKGKNLLKVMVIGTGIGFLGLAAYKAYKKKRK
jgi:hypothetical protein